MVVETEVESGGGLERPKTLRAAIAARVSTQDQAESGTSLDTQLEAMRRYCASQGYEINPQFVIREDHTGTDLERPGVKRLLNGAGQGAFDVIIFYTLDRAYRPKTNGEEWRVLQLISEFKTHGVSVEFVDGSIPSTGPFSGLLTMLNAFAAGEERRKILKRSKEGKAQRLMEGKWMQGKPPHGYRIGEDKRLEVNPEEAEVVRLIFETYGNTRMGLRALAMMLTGLYKSPRANTVWQATTVRRILLNPAYIGRQAYGLPTPPIIDEELFERVQERFDTNKRVKLSTSRVWALQGRTSCICGATWFCASNNGINSGGRKPRYACSSRKLRGSTCPVPRFDAVELEGNIWQELRAKFADPANLLTVLDGAIANLRAQMKGLEREAGPIQDALHEVEEKLKRVAASYIDGILSRKKLEAFRDEAEKTKKELQGQLDILAPGRLEEIEQARRKLQGAEDLANTTRHRLRLGIPTDVFNYHPDLAESEEQRDFDQAGLNAQGSEEVAISLKAMLDRLQARVFMFPDRIEIRGIISVEVLLEPVAHANTTSGCCVLLRTGQGPV
ncbi:MAG: recombinase family protein [Dehalococcoidia bacterium]